MRIISGEWKGRKLLASIPSGVRPTADSTRETMFNILNNYVEFEGAHVLDLCAGTGALGFESLSRGAEYVCSVEKNRKTATFIQQNASILKIDESTHTIVVDDALAFVRKFDAQSQKPFSLVFADPPYALTIINQLLDSLSANQVLENGAIVVVEHGANEAVLKHQHFTQLTKRELGETIFEVLQYSA